MPEGRYECIVERVEVRESKSSDNYYLLWELNVQDDDYEGRKLWTRTTLGTPDGEGGIDIHPHPFVQSQIKDSFIACGVDEDADLDIEWADDLDVTPEEGPILTEPDVFGSAIIAVVSNEMYENREVNRVDRMEPASAPAAKGNGSKKSGSRAKSASGSGSRRSGGRRKLR